MAVRSNSGGGSNVTVAELHIVVGVSASGNGIMFGGDYARVVGNRIAGAKTCNYVGFHSA